MLKRVTICLDEELHASLREAARSEHRSLSGQIAFFCSQSVARRPPPTSYAPPRPTYDQPNTADGQAAPAITREGSIL